MRHAMRLMCQAAVAAMLLIASAKGAQSQNQIRGASGTRTVSPFLSRRFTCRQVTVASSRIATESLSSDHSRRAITSSRSGASVISRRSSKYMAAEVEAFEYHQKDWTGTLASRMQGEELGVTREAW